MAFSNQQILNLTEVFVRKRMTGEGTGHDYYHIERVIQIAEKISKEEGQGNLFLIKLAALLHDIADWKFYNADETVGPRVAREFLGKLKANKEIIDEVSFIISNISYKGGIKQTPMRTIEGKIVQDADRLDAMGAIGIARAFAYGGFKGRQIHDPHTKTKKKYKSLKEYHNTNSTSINHFYEKLFLIKGLMNTKTAKKIAKERHKFMENFLKEFYAEWESKI